MPVAGRAEAKVKPAMHQFMLVDLYSQAEFIPREVRQPPERFLAWLRQFGEVKSWPVRGRSRPDLVCVSAAERAGDALPL